MGLVHLDRCLLVQANLGVLEIYLSDVLARVRQNGATTNSLALLDKLRTILLVLSIWKMKNTGNTPFLATSAAILHLLLPLLFLPPLSLRRKLAGGFGGALRALV